MRISDIEAYDELLADRDRWRNAATIWTLIAMAEALAIALIVAGVFSK